MEERQITFQATNSSGDVSAILLMPADPQWLLVLAHGAGAGMRHRSMEAYAARLAERGFATFRYQFPYMENRKGRPDPPPIAAKTVRSAVETATALAPGLPLLAGGKSFGGRMTSTSQSQEELPGVKGLVFYGFPLHAPGRPSADRADHLYQVKIPMLFLQGTRDSFANLEYLKPVVDRIGEAATLEIIDQGDHSFKVPKSSGMSEEHVMNDLADRIVNWGAKVRN